MSVVKRVHDWDLVREFDYFEAKISRLILIPHCTRHLFFPLTFEKSDPVKLIDLELASEEIQHSQTIGQTHKSSIKYTSETSKTPPGS